MTYKRTPIQGLDVLIDEDTGALVIGESGSDSQVGQERLTMAAAAQSATIPATTQKVLINAEGAELRYSLSGAATATVGGRIPQDGTLLLRVASTSTLSIYGAVGAYANLEYLKRG